MFCADFYNPHPLRNFMKIRPRGAEFFASGQTDGHNEGNSSLSQLCERV